MPQHRKWVKALLNGGTESVEAVLNTGYSEDEIVGKIKELEEEKLDLDAQFDYLTSEIKTKIQQARETSDSVERDDLLREIRRLKNKAEAVKERRDDIYLELETWEEIIGTHEFEVIVDSSEDDEVSLEGIDKRDLEGRMEEIAKERRKRRRKSDSIKKKVESVRNAGKELDLEEERRAVAGEGVSSSEVRDETLNELEQTIQELEEREKDQGQI